MVKIKNIFFLNVIDLFVEYCVGEKKKYVRFY